MPHKPINPSMTLLEDELAQEERALVRSIEELFFVLVGEYRTGGSLVAIALIGFFLRGSFFVPACTYNLNFFFQLASRAGMVLDNTG